VQQHSELPLFGSTIPSHGVYGAATSVPCGSPNLCLCQDSDGLVDQVARLWCNSMVIFVLPIGLGVKRQGFGLQGEFTNRSLGIFRKINSQVYLGAAPPPLQARCTVSDKS